MARRRSASVLPDHGSTSAPLGMPSRNSIPSTFLFMLSKVSGRYRNNTILGLPVPKTAEKSKRNSHVVFPLLVAPETQDVDAASKGKGTASFPK